MMTMMTTTVMMLLCMMGTMILDDAGDAGDVQDVCIPADDGDDGDNDVDDADSGEEEDDDVNDRDDGDGRYNDGGDCDDNGCRANDDSDESVLTMMMIPTDFTTVMLMMTLDGGFSLTTLLTVVTWMTLVPRSSACQSIGLSRLSLTRCCRPEQMFFDPP